MISLRLRRGKVTDVEHKSGRPVTTNPCPFCERVQQRDYIVHYEDENCVVFEPLHPVTGGHLLVVPAEHVEHGWSDDAVARAMKVASNIAKDSYNLITSHGSPATQTVPHVHVHVVPRTEGDGLMLPWTNQESRWWR